MAFGDDKGATIDNKRTNNLEQLDCEYQQVNTVEINEQQPLPQQQRNDDEITKEKIVNIRETFAKAKKDLGNILLLTFFYALQCIPLGLSTAVPLILSSRSASYTDQGKFSFVMWPYSLKLLWAPIVDSLFIRRIGRRKTWLVPTQLLIGVFMLLFSGLVQENLDQNFSDGSSSVGSLAAIFFVFNILATIQDVAVDGWSLTLLSKENVSWGSTSSAIGTTFGWFIGNSFFLVFESADFSNRYIRSILGLPNQEYGLTNVKNFMNFFGIFYIVATLLVLFLIKEKHEEHVKSKNFPITYTYKLIYNILRLKPMRSLILLFLTVRLGLGAEGISTLKLIEAGVPRANIGLLYIPLMPLLIILPILISKYSNGPRPLTFFIRALQLKYAGMVLSALFVFITPYFKDSDGLFPFHYYLLFLAVSAFNGIFNFSSSTAQGAFFNRISDPNVGGTYITFLNTINNLSNIWPPTFYLFILNFITFKKCSFDAIYSTFFESVKHAEAAANETATTTTTTTTATMTELTLKNLTAVGNLLPDIKMCTAATTQDCLSYGGKCITYIEGYYILSGIGLFLGVMWLIFLTRKFIRLQDVKKSDWFVCKYSKATLHNNHNQI